MKAPTAVVLDLVGARWNIRHSDADTYRSGGDAQNTDRHQPDLCGNPMCSRCGSDHPIAPSLSPLAHLIAVRDLDIRRGPRAWNSASAGHLFVGRITDFRHPEKTFDAIGPSAWRTTKEPKRADRISWRPRILGDAELAQALLGPGCPGRAAHHVLRERI